MQTSAPPAEVLYFHCGRCRSELSVPIGLQGVEGPCPCCGMTIAAPWEWNVESERRVHLPPLDLRHEDPMAETAPVGYPQGGDGIVIPAAWQKQELVLNADPEAEASCAEGLLLKGPGRGVGFSAKLSIPESDEPLDASWHRIYSADRRKASTMKKLDRGVGRFLDSSAFRVLRMVILVGMGGMCAGLTLYLKERNWALDLPWRAQPAPKSVGLPVRPPVKSVQSADPLEPFAVEDPSELERVRSQTVQLPLPEVLVRDVSAQPISGVDR